MIPSAAAPLNPRLLADSMEGDPNPSALLELTTGLAQGDAAAWAAFHRDFGPGLFRRLLFETRGDHALASEALQQCYLRIARHARPCDSRPMFASWLRMIARSALSDCRRRRRSFLDLLRRHGAEPPPEAENPADDFAAGALDTALSRLDGADRALLEGKYFAGKDVRTLAAELDVSPKAAESRLTRARAELRRHLLEILKSHE